VDRSGHGEVTNLHKTGFTDTSGNDAGREYGKLGRAIDHLVPCLGWPVIDGRPGPG
jgi:hypothetical protein